MSHTERAVLRVGSMRYYEEQVALIAAGVSRAFAGEEAANGEK